MNPKHYLVTGGTGFLGSALVRRLLRDGHRVRVLDNNSRGHLRRLAGLQDAFEFVEADIRDPEAVAAACHGVDAVCHLAYVNGTESFYSKPGLVLDIAVHGMLNVLHGCRDAGVGELALASSSEAYQTPPVVPTPETVPLIIAELANPRCSYGGGKIVCELLAMHYGCQWLDRLIIFRPHNIYGADMGWEHVVPQFVLRMKELARRHSETVRFPIQGTGDETRAFMHVDDFSAALARVLDRGAHREIYHLGNDQEVTIAEVARLVGRYFERAVELVPGPLQPGSPLRRCPDIQKIRRLGFAPSRALAEALPDVARWYDQHAHLRNAPSAHPIPLAA